MFAQQAVPLFTGNHNFHDRRSQNAQPLSSFDHGCSQLAGGRQEGQLCDQACVCSGMQQPRSCNRGGLVACYARCILSPSICHRPAFPLQMVPLSALVQHHVQNY